MTALLTGLARTWTIAEIELRQRIVSRTFLVICIVFGAVLLVLSGLVMLGWGVLRDAAGPDGDGGVVFATTLLLTVFLSTVLVPVLSGGAVNGDRAAGTLATTQLTLVSTWQLLLGKVLAAWLSSLALVGIAVPFLVLGAVISDTGPLAVAAAVGSLTLEFAVFSALGVAWSAIVRSTVFSVVCTYLTLSLLSVGTFVAFTMGGTLITTTSTITVYQYDPVANDSYQCVPVQHERTSPRFDIVYPLLAANPYVIVIDSLPLEFDERGEPQTFLGQLQTGLRMAQLPPDRDTVEHWCGTDTEREPTERTLEGTVPTWWYGALLHVLLCGLLLWWGWSKTRTPAGRLAAGSRVA